MKVKVLIGGRRGTVFSKKVLASLLILWCAAERQEVSPGLKASSFEQRPLAALSGDSGPHARDGAEGGACRSRRDEDAELAASGSCGRQHEFVGTHLVTDPLILK